MKPTKALSRSDLILALAKFCLKQYPPIKPSSDRTVTEHLLYGCCLENSPDDAADEAFAKLQENFYDWNEVRVTTTAELAEMMKRLTYPKQAANNIRKTLHGTFETFYKFELDFLKKENLGKAVAQFEKFKGVSPFIIAYVTQNGLDGHSIPLDRALMFLFYTLGIATEQDIANGRIPGLERTIPKTQGLDFSSSVHQMAVQYLRSPFSPQIRQQILAINPDAKDRFPKRGEKKNIDQPDSNIVNQADSEVATKADATERIEVTEKEPQAPKRRGRKKKSESTTTQPKATKKTTTKATKKTVAKKTTVGSAGNAKKTTKKNTDIPKKPTPKKPAVKVKTNTRRPKPR